MQTFRDRATLRTLTRKRYKRLPLRAIVRNWWDIHGETVRQRSAFFVVGILTVLGWVGVMMLAEYVTQRFAS